MNNKFDDLSCVLKDDNVDIACISETWLKEDIPNDVVGISGYIMYRHDRSHKRGGGVAVYVRDTIPHHTWPDLQDPEFESLWITLRPLRMPRMFSHITIAVLYHPPNANSWKMCNHVSRCLDAVLQKHPSSGIVLVI